MNFVSLSNYEQNKILSIIIKVILMLKHKEIWNAIDKLAQINGMTPSGLAKKSGLDATIFNKSKESVKMVAVAGPQLKVYLRYSALLV